MKITKLILFCFVCFGIAAASVLLQKEQLKSQFDSATKFVQNADKAFKKYNLEDITVECGLCGIALNEIEGFVAENMTESEIQAQIDSTLCTLLYNGLQSLCDDIVDQIPYIIANIEDTNSVSVICVDLGYCAKPFTPQTDPQPIPQFVVNLDLPPMQRWTEVCSVPLYQNVTQYLVNTVTSILPDNGNAILEIGNLLNEYYLPTEYAQEIQGCAQALGIPYGWVTLLNLGYEVSDACTSIIAQTTDGKILHARNMDFWEGMGFTNSLRDIAIQAEFQQGGKTLFTSTGFAGFVGVLSGLKPNAFSVTIDTRFYPQGISELFYEVIAAIVERNASLVTFLSRDVFQNENTFASAVENLSNDELIADVYYIVAGVSAGEGAVISRNRLNASDVWMLDAPSRWYEVETNYDHWEQPPWFDDRVVPANNGMNALGREDLSLEGMFKVLSIKPVLNLQTTYTILACPADGTYQSFVRYCPYPCAE